MNDQKITIAMVSDIVCPWCYIGKRNLEKALMELNGTYPVAVSYHPFQLDPTVPKTGKPFLEYMDQRFGGNAVEKFQRVEAVGKGVGLAFKFAEIPAAINTFDLHRLLYLAKAEGKQGAVKEAFMQAYFLDRRDLSDPEEVARVMTVANWRKEKTLDILSTKEGALAVKEEMEAYQRLGVRGVPFFILNQKYAVNGAQPPEVFVSAIRQIAEEVGLQPVETGGA